MTAVCNIRGKRPGFGMSASHSHRRNKRRFNPNIQRVRVLVKGIPKHLNVCIKYIESERVVRSVIV